MSENKEHTLSELLTRMDNEVTDSIGAVGQSVGRDCSCDRALIYLRHITDCGRDDAFSSLLTQAGRDGTAECEIRFLDPQNHESYAWLKTKLKVLQSDDKSRIMLGDFENITANRTLESIRKKQELRDAVEAAHKDSSTGVYNKFFTESIIRKKLTAEADGICMLLILDVDMLKQINDNYGHPVGDQVIVAVAGVMREQFRENDVIGRIGGDEFMGLVCGLKNEAMARNIVERLLGAVSKIKICDFGISVSIGCVLTEPGREDFDVLYSKADKALYHIKKNCKNNYDFYTSEND